MLNERWDMLTESCLQYWTALIKMAEEANPISPREGKLLKQVPLESRLTENKLSANLGRAITHRLHMDSPSLLINLWINCTPLQLLHTLLSFNLHVSSPS